MFWCPKRLTREAKWCFVTYYDLDIQIFQIYGHTTRIPDFRVIGPSKIRLESDMADSPDFYNSEIRGDRFTDVCVHTARFSGNGLQKVSWLKNIEQWDDGRHHQFWRDINDLRNCLFCEITGLDGHRCTPKQNILKDIYFLLNFTFDISVE